MFKQALLRRWHALRDWIRDGKHLWRWLGIAAVICAAAYFFPVTLFGWAAELADRVRWAGLLLQFAGLWTVAIGLGESRRLFNKEPIWRATVGWISRFRYVFVLRNPVTHIIEHQGLTVSTSVAMDALVTRANRTPEERIAELERSVTEIRDKLGSQIGALRSDTDKSLEEERRERAEHDRRIGEQVETAVIGGIHLELSGLFYLIFGILLATIPGEAAALLQWIGL